ncbi:WD40 repeat-like protein [Rozella allomycis CSF55]|uniref:Protein HIR n=1 Tax=Rozella allomycis (strain CSF55) TaxID=988480 RepID=A0A4P9YT35_ROZAC|nr:WD40 repeat-like protein [Rozella allomycis CSF55]
MSKDYLRGEGMECIFCELDYERMIEQMTIKKHEIELCSKKIDYKVIYKFLKKIKEAKTAEYERVLNEIKILDEDYKNVEKFVENLDYSDDETFEVPENDSRMRNGAKRSHSEMQNSFYSTFLNLDKRTSNHLGDLTASYFNHRLNSGTFQSFSEVISKFFKYSHFRIIKSIHVSDITHSNQIVSSIEFNTKGSLFATGGVTKKIRIFDFHSIVEDKSLTLHCPSHEIQTPAKISCLCWNSFLKSQIACSDYEGAITIYDVEKGSNPVMTFDEHEKRAWSVHVSPSDPMRLASGSDDCRVKIWSINQRQSVLTIDSRVNVDCLIKIWRFNALEELEDDREQKCLATLNRHQGTVLCVRWSPKDGRYLASCSDDRVILIWKYEGKSNNIGNLVSSDSVESYTVAKRITGHESDVVDLAWSFDEKYLASCGLDNQIIVWSTRDFSMVQKLEGHSGFVKGLAWDPANTFLASQSDDKSVTLWRIGEWRAEKKISEPFKDSIGACYFLRLSWSPDGAFIASTDAYNNGVSVSAILSRDESWKPSNSLVGHEGSVEVVKFSPIIYGVSEGRKRGEEDQGINVACLLAVGSHDNSISIWMTNQARPLAIFKNVFQENIHDMSWSSDGMHLLACGSDGTVVVMQLEKDDIKAKPLSKSQRESLMNESGFMKKENRLIENVVQLKFEREKSKVEGLIDVIEESDSQPLITTRVIHDLPDHKNVPREQIITKTKDGKRRITPMLIQKLDNEGNIKQSSNEPVLKEKSKSKRVTHCEPVTLTNKLLEIKPQPFYAMQTTINEAQYQLEAKNQQSYIQLVLRKDKKYFWSDILPGQVLCGVLNENFVAVACSGSKLIVYSQNGRRIFPVILLADEIVSLYCQNHFLICVSKDERVNVWDVKRMKCVVESASITSILKTSNLFSLEIENNSRLKAKMENNKCFFFHPDLRVWCPLESEEFRLADSMLFEAIYNPLDYESFEDSLEWIKELSMAPLSIRRKATISHIENQIASSQLLDIEKQVYWWKLYAKNVADQGLFEKAKEIVSLVKDTEFENLILSILSQNRKFQSLFQ